MDEPRDLTIKFPGRRGRHQWLSGGWYTPLGGNLYRLDEGPLCGPVSFHDVIEADKTEEEDVLIFRRRVTKAGLKRGGWLITYAITSKPGFRELVKRIDQLGGCAEVDLFAGTRSPLKPNTAGVLTVFLPKSRALDVPAELDRIERISKWKRRFFNLRSSVKQTLWSARKWLRGRFRRIGRKRGANCA